MEGGTGRRRESKAMDQPLAEPGPHLGPAADTQGNSTRRETGGRAGRPVPSPGFRLCEWPHGVRSPACVSHKVLPGAPSCPEAAAASGPREG